jgi:demethylsterigmatocystin 6-O-methyltransferase
MNTDMHAFEWLNANPEVLQSFANHMAGYATGCGFWLDTYPVERLLDGFVDERPLLVDVGGSIGHDAQTFRKRYPQTTGKLIVQDQTPVIAAAQGKVDESIELMVHDFFTPQPVEGKVKLFSMIKIEAKMSA